MLLNQVFHPDPQATSQYLSGLAEELVRRGHQVTVLAARRDYENPQKEYPARETWRGVEIIRVWNLGLGHGSKGGRMLDFLSFLLAAAWQGLFLPRVDVVMALTTPPLISVLGAFLALRARARFIYWVLDLNPDEAIAVGWLAPEGLPARFLEAASRWSLHRASRVIVPDGFMQERLEKKGIAGGKIAVVPLWSQGEIAFDAAGRERYRQKLGLGNKHVVMYAGNHSPCHPLTTLVDAALQLRNEPGIHFCFVGGGMEWKRLWERAEAEHWVNATFLGYQPFEDLPGLLSAADTQVVVMGDPFVGIIHPCKVYNFLAARRPFIYVGPERSHITDLIRAARLEGVTASFRHGDAAGLATEIRRRATMDVGSAWPDEAMTTWGEPVLLRKMIDLIEEQAPEIRVPALSSVNR